MAFDLLSLRAKLGLDSSEYEQGLASARGLGMTASVAIGNLVSKGISAATNAVKGFASDTMAAGASFESVMSGVAAISGATGGDIDRLSAKAQEMGAKTKFSATESGEAFTYMAMAGWKTEDMLNGIEGIMNLAAASGESLATTSDIVTDALTAMGYKAGDAGRLADVMAAASSNANTNVGLMGETFKYAAPVAGALGYSMEDTALAIGLMANAGIKGSQAGTSLRSVFTRLAAPPKQAAAAMEQYGISLTNSDGTMRSFNEVMVDMRDKFKDLDPVQQTNVANAIAGKNAMSGFLAIINASDEDFNQLSTAIQNSNGAAQEMSETMQNNLTGSVTILKSATEGLQLAFYDGIKGVAKDAVDSLADAVSRMTTKVREWMTKDETQAKLSKVAESIQRVIDKISGNLDPILNGLIGIIDNVVNAAGFFMDNLSQIGSVITTVVTVIAAFKAALTAAKVVMAAMNFVGFISNPVGAVVVAISGLIAIITLLVTNFDKVKAGAKAAWQDIKNAWSNAASWFSGIVNGIKNAFANIGTAIAKFFTDGWNAIKNTWSGVTSFFSGIVNGVKNAWSGITGFFSGLGSNIKQAISGALSNLPSMALGWARDMMAGFGRGITNFMDTVTRPIKNLASKISSFLHFSRPDEGPLRDYETWMPDFIKGMASGIDKNVWRLEDAASNAAAAMADNMYSGYGSDTGAIGRASNYNFTINVNGAKYSDDRSLAQAIAEEIQSMVDRRQAVYA